MLVPSLSCVEPVARFKKVVQICRDLSSQHCVSLRVDHMKRECLASPFALLPSASYLMPRCTLLCTASSNAVTLFVVRIMTPWKYSNCRRKTETSVLCCRCWRSRDSRNTSASSRSKIALQRATRSSIWVREYSSPSASRPRSPAVA